MAKAVQTPLPLPDMSSPSNSLPNLSFIISISIEFYEIKQDVDRLKKGYEKKSELNGINKVIKLETFFITFKF